MARHATTARAAGARAGADGTEGAYLVASVLAPLAGLLLTVAPAGHLLWRTLGLRGLEQRRHGGRAGLAFLGESGEARAAVIHVPLRVANGARHHPAAGKEGTRSVRRRGERAPPGLSTSRARARAAHAGEGRAEAVVVCGCGTVRVLALARRLTPARGTIGWSRARAACRMAWMPTPAPVTMPTPGTGARVRASERVATHLVLRLWPHWWHVLPEPPLFLRGALFSPDGEPCEAHAKLAFLSADEPGAELKPLSLSGDAALAIAGGQRRQEGRGRQHAQLAGLQGRQWPLCPSAAPRRTNRLPRVDRCECNPARATVCQPKSTVIKTTTFAKCKIPREPLAPRRRASLNPQRALGHSGPPAAASLKP